jgi:5,10-methenyltetrahydrofolate synthetase
MEDWDEIREWRRLLRTELRAKRSALPSREKESVRTRVCDLILESLPELRDACIGFYWPFQGEIDLRQLVRGFLALGAEAALPVVVEKATTNGILVVAPANEIGAGDLEHPDSKRAEPGPTDGSARAFAGL